MKSFFRRFAEGVAHAVGTPWAFFLALGGLVLWSVAGPLFQFSEQWQLAINSVTTIVTFLMVFIIQNTQNRDFKSLQLKLDILLYASEDTHKGLVRLHRLSDEDLHRFEETIRRLRGRHDIDEIVQSIEDSFAEKEPAK